MLSVYYYRDSSQYFYTTCLKSVVFYTHNTSQLGSSGGTMAKNLLANAGDTRDLGSIPGSGRSPGEGNDNPLQYSCLGYMDRGPWWAIVHGVTKCGTQLSN